ncbi:hypothetical protein VB711_12260 [Cronbergia sp. UHCC 0137]|uniref:PFE-CTERM domain-containing protein n=1 Tax=Cronbergia sp. UHCC 0137 TaxID=3110239 RepID=UPI002B215C3A|nr:hypothetical protein [Cronbergia sp. UHCC 0137]MEA5618603.1 hypothetical protein [Cronbergia sp. UHCC 0137]
MTGFVASVLLNVTPANALSFTFSFQNVNGDAPTGGFVTGTLDGLVEGDNSGTGITATVLSSPGGGLGAYSFNGTANSANAFVVNGGNITFADAEFIQGNNVLNLGTPGNSGFGSILVDFPSYSFDYADFSNATTTFTPATPVPFEFNPTLGLATLGIWFGVSKLRKKYSLNH